MLLFWVLVFLLMLGLLIKSADWFTDNAERFGERLNVSQFIIGVVIVAIGTSLPELATSIAAVIDKESEIVMGDVLGSNIVNILLGLGLAAIVAKEAVRMRKNIFSGDFPVLIAATVLVFFTIADGKVTFYETILYLIGLVIYFRHISHLQKRHREENVGRGELDWGAITKIIFSGVLLFLSAKFLITATVEISNIILVGTSVIAASAIALGTSLPEIMVATVSARKGRYDLAMGNIIGSCVFNIFGVVGLAGLFGVLVVPAGIVSFVLPFTIAAVFIYGVVLLDEKIISSEGAIMVLLYILFIVKLLNIV